MSSVVILDVGHGNSAVLRDTEGTVVVDAGPGSALLEFIRRSGIDEIDVLLISHADEDHIGGAVGLLAADDIKVNVVRLNSDGLKDTAAWRDLTAALDDASRGGEVDFVPSLVPANTGEFDQGTVTVEIVGPSPLLAARGPGGEDAGGRRITPNSISAVIRMSREGKGIVLLPGDLDLVGLKDLVRVGADLTAEVVVYPHHGGASGGSDSDFARELCTRVRPRMVVFSIGRGVHGTPKQEVVEGVRSSAPEARIACTQLSEHCEQQIPSVDPTHLADVYARGRSKRRCCAGSVVVEAGDSTSILPHEAGHREFVQSCGSPLCLR